MSVLFNWEASICVKLLLKIISIQIRGVIPGEAVKQSGFEVIVVEKMLLTVNTD